MKYLLFVLGLFFSTAYAFDVYEEVEKLNQEKPFPDLNYSVRTSQWMRNYIDDNPRTRGAYLLDDNMIVFSDKINEKTFYHTNYHEEGHYVFFNHLTNKQRENWITHFKQSPIKWCVSEYGLTANGNKNEAPFECFAEVYAFVVHDSHFPWSKDFLPAYWYGEKIEDSWEHRFVRHYAQ